MIPTVPTEDCSGVFLRNNDASISDVHHIWGSAEPTLTVPFSPYTADFDDGYPLHCEFEERLLIIYYRAEARLTEYDEENGWHDLPDSISFDANTR